MGDDRDAGVASPGDVERSNLDEVFGIGSEQGEDTEAFQEADI